MPEMAQVKRLNLRSMPEWNRLRREDVGREAWIHPDLANSKYVYRYMDLRGAIETFESASFRMKPPRRWDDPYETWWCDQLFEHGTALARAKAYGLCWTTRNRDEPFWRLYTCPDRPTEPAIRLRTTIATLRAQMLAMIHAEVGKAFLGRVRYAPVTALYDKAALLTVKPKDQVARTAAQGLHWKRSQFILEREVRLLWVVTADIELPFYSLAFDRATFIDQVMVGPTTDSDKALDAKRQLIDAGAPKGIVKRSLLYKRAK